MAGTTPNLPGCRSVACTIRIGRQTPRRKDQPRGRRGAAPSPDRPVCRPVAHRTGRQSLCRQTESTRQTRRDHRLRPGASRHPHRPRPGPRPHHLRPGPLELTRDLGVFPRSLAHAPGRRRSPRAAPAAQRGRTTWTATRTGAHSRADRGKPTPANRKETRPTPFTTTNRSATLEVTKGRSDAVPVMAEPHRGGYAETNLAPALRPIAARTTPDDPR